MKFSTLIRRLDIFGVPITFVGFNRLKYQTKLGGIITIFLVGWLSYNIILQFIQMISKNSAVVLTNAIFTDIPTLIQINNQNFMFALQVQQKDYIKQPYFIFELEADTVLDGKQKITQSIQMAECTLEDFQNLYFYNKNMLETLLINDYKNWVCPQFNGQTLNLQGRFGSDIFQYLKISVKPCELGIYPSNYICPSQQETVDFVNSLDSQMIINFMVTNLNVNTASQNGYTGYIDRDIYILINPLKQLGQLDVYLRNWDVYTNPSIINDQSTDHNQYLVLEQQDVKDRYIFREYTNQAEIAKLYIRNSQYMFYTKRHYVSIGDFLAYVGGIFGSLFTLAYAIMSLYAYEQMWLKLFKIHYTLLAEDKDCKNLNTIVDEKFSMHNILIPNLKSFICFFKKDGRKHISTYFESQAIILEDLSIVTYLKMLKDLQKIKLILFNDKQQQVLDLYNKDTIVLQNYQQQHSHKLEEGKKYLYGHKFQEQTLSQYKKIIDSYDQLLQSKDSFQLQITKRINNIFDKDLQRIIQVQDYKQLKTQRSTMIELPIIVSQYSLSRDITRIINYENQYDLQRISIDSLLKSIFYKRQTIYISSEISLQFESEINQNIIIYTITINNRFQEYNLIVQPRKFIQYHNFIARKHKFECQIQTPNELTVPKLIEQSIELKINQFTLYFNCSLSVHVCPIINVTQIPKDFRTQLLFYLEQQNQEQFQVLSYLFNKQKFLFTLFQTSEIIFIFNQNVVEVQNIEILLNWPNSELLLNELIIKKDPLIQFLQIIYDLFIQFMN